MDNISVLTQKLGKENVLLNEEMSKHTSFKVGGKADIFVKIQNKEGLKDVITFAKENGLDLFILGNGSNLLVKDKGIRGIVCKIELEKFEIHEKSTEILATIRKWK